MGRFKKSYRNEDEAEPILPAVAGARLTATLAKKLGCFANDIFVEKTGMFCRRYCFSLFKEPDC